MEGYDVDVDSDSRTRTVDVVPEFSACQATKFGCATDRHQPHKLAGDPCISSCDSARTLFDGRMTSLKFQSRFFSSQQLSRPTYDHFPSITLLTAFPPSSITLFN